MIIGIVQADRGVIELNGEDMTALSMHERARHGIGYLPQEASIFRKLSVGDNILAILETRPDLNKKQRLERRDQLLEEFHVEHLRDSLGQALSGGERRRIEIARALAAEPDFILLDEPFAGVDPISVSDIKNIINHLRDRGIGVLITDHNVRDTLDICEKAFIVGEGHIIASGTAEDVLSSDHVRRIYLGDQFQL
jgi:lipopolysaccharide export system ATP-binding protein